MFTYDDIDFPLLHSSLVLLSVSFAVCGGLYLLRQLAQGAQGDYPTNPLAMKSRRLIGLGSMFLVLTWFAYHFTNRWVILVQAFMFFGYYLAIMAICAKQRDEDAILVTNGIACGLLFLAGFRLGPTLSILIALALVTRIGFWLLPRPKSMELT